MIRSTVCIAAFLVARIGGCGGPQPEVAPETADLAPEVRIERPPEPSTLPVPAPGESSDEEGNAPPGEADAAGPAGGEATDGPPPLPPLPAPLGLLGGSGGEGRLDLPPGVAGGSGDVIVTPEPATLLLAGVGLVVGALWTRLRRRRSAT